MERDTDNSRFPEQQEPIKQHGLSDIPASASIPGIASDHTAVSRLKEKYLREVAKPEDAPGNGGEPVEENSVHIKPDSAEDKKD